MKYHSCEKCGVTPYIEYFDDDDYDEKKVEDDTSYLVALKELYLKRKRVPRVVPDQKAKFESDELFRRLSRESEIRYTGGRDRGKEERQSRFQRDLHDGHTEVAFVTNGMNVQLVFTPPTQDYNRQDKECDFDKEPGKVHIKSSFIMNGVCVRWRGWIDLERLDGVGCLEYDEELGAKEEARRDSYMKMR